MNIVKFAKCLVIAAASASAAACAAPTDGDNTTPSGTEAPIGTTDDALTVCSPTLVGAAITKQIVSVAQPTSLTVELVTITPQPYRLQASSLSYPSGLALSSIATTSCSVSGSNYKCRHQAVLQAITACTGTGSYSMFFNYVADQGSLCPSGRPERVDFRLTTENFCSETSVAGK